MARSARTYRAARRNEARKRHELGQWARVRSKRLLEMSVGASTKRGRHVVERPGRAFAARVAAKSHAFVQIFKGARARGG